MKRITSLLLCALLVIFMAGCNNETNGTHADLPPQQTNDTSAELPMEETGDAYVLLPMEKTIGAVNRKIIDNHLKESKDFPYYEKLKENAPYLFPYLKHITPEALKGKCSIYRFTYKPVGGLQGETFLVYDDAVYHLGWAWGGYGITEFAYTTENGSDILYFTYSFGSGIVHSRIGSFNFDTKEIRDYGRNMFLNHDIAFCLSEGSKTLGVCRAEVRWPDWDALGVTIDRGDCLCEDIRELEYVVVNAEE